MPSGLTARIVDDEGDTFEAFVWRCASTLFYDCSRAPDEVREKESFYARSLEVDRRDLAALTDMSDAAVLARALAERDGRLKYARESLARAQRVAARVGLIRCKVEAWTPPTRLHDVGLKGLMNEQLDQLCEYEANVEARRKGVAEIENEPMPKATEWRRGKIEALRDGIARTERQLAEETARIAAQNAWLEALRKSVPRPADEWGGRR